MKYRSSGFITTLAPLRDYLFPEDPKSPPPLRAAKGGYFTRLSVDIGPTQPDLGGWAQWITSEDINVQHLLDVFNANSDDVWKACVGFVRHPYWHKTRLTVLRSEIEGLPCDCRSKLVCLFEFSRILVSIGHRTECKHLLTHTLKLKRERGDDHSVAHTLRDLSGVNKLMGLPREGIA